MNRPSEFTTSDIELAACFLTAGGKLSRIIPGRELVEFVFPLTEITREIAIEYAAGDLCQKVRLLARNRSWLYRQIREVARTGREVRG